MGPTEIYAEWNLNGLLDLTVTVVHATGVDVNFFCAKVPNGVLEANPGD